MERLFIRRPREYDCEVDGAGRRLEGVSWPSVRSVGLRGTAFSRTVVSIDGEGGSGMAGGGKLLATVGAGGVGSEAGLVSGFSALVLVRDGADSCPKLPRIRIRA